MKWYTIVNGCKCLEWKTLTMDPCASTFSLFQNLIVWLFWSYYCNELEPIHSEHNFSTRGCTTADCCFYHYLCPRGIFAFIIQSGFFFYSYAICLSKERGQSVYLTILKLLLQSYSFTAVNKWLESSFIADIIVPLHPNIISRADEENVIIPDNEL